MDYDLFDRPKRTGLLYYKYYDTPEGKDLFPKLLYTTKYSALAGLVLSSYDVTLISHPKTYMATIGRYITLTAPLVGMAAAFTATTYISCKIREKDDKTNYVLGGVAAGGMFGLCTKAVTKGIGAAVILGAFAASKKLSKEEGWEFFPDPGESIKGGVSSVHKDRSVMWDGERSWTTNPNEA